MEDQCTTVHTTYVPIRNTDCWPGAAGGTYYWRVIAIDAPGRTIDGDDIVTDGIVAEVGRFTYEPALVTVQSPATGATVFVPTLRWFPVSGASEYRVSVIATDGGGGGGSWETTGTSYTPRARLTVGKSYRWTVQTVGLTGREGSALIPGSQPTFKVGDPGVATASSPGPGCPGCRQPVEQVPDPELDAGGRSYVIPDPGPSGRRRSAGPMSPTSSPIRLARIARHGLARCGNVRMGRGGLQRQHVAQPVVDVAHVRHQETSPPSPASVLRTTEPP